MAIITEHYVQYRTSWQLKIPVMSCCGRQQKKPSLLVLVAQHLIDGLGQYFQVELSVIKSQDLFSKYYATLILESFQTNFMLIILFAPNKKSCYYRWGQQNHFHLQRNIHENQQNLFHNENKLMVLDLIQQRYNHHQLIFLLKRNYHTNY